MVFLKPIVALPNAYQWRALLELAEVHQTARDDDLEDAPLDAYVVDLEPEIRAVDKAQPSCDVCSRAIWRARVPLCLVFSRA